MTDLPILATVSSPADLRSLDEPTMVRLAAEIACRRDRYSMPPVQVEVLSRSDPYGEAPTADGGRAA